MPPILLSSGWWLVTKSAKQQSSCIGTQKERIGYIASDYLRPYKDHDVWKLMSSEDLQKYLGFVGPENMAAGSTEDTEVGSTEDTEVKYVAVQDYHTEDPCQLCLTKEEIVLVMEKSEDGMLAEFILAMITYL